METTIRIHGLREIKQALAALPGRLDQNLLNKGLVEGAKLVRDQARALVPLLAVPDPRRRRGTLQRAIQTARVRPEPGMRATVWVRLRPLTRRQIARFKVRQGRGGGRVAAGENPNDPFYWRFVEFGTSKMPARPFMRPAFESRKFAAVKKAIDTLRPLVQAEIMKLGRGL